MSAEEPILVAYDGSEDARRAIEESTALLEPAPALVVHVWQPVVEVVHHARLPVLTVRSSDR